MTGASELAWARDKVLLRRNQGFQRHNQTVAKILLFRSNSRRKCCVRLRNTAIAATADVIIDVVGDRSRRRGVAGRKFACHETDFSPEERRRVFGQKEEKLVAETGDRRERAGRAGDFHPGQQCSKYNMKEREQCWQRTEQQHAMVRWPRERRNWSSEVGIRRLGMTGGSWNQKAGWRGRTAEGGIRWPPPPPSLVPRPGCSPVIGLSHTPMTEPCALGCAGVGLAR